MTTSLWNAWRKPKARRAARRQASGSSPFTWKIGAWTILATSVGYSDDRADSGAVVNPSWLFTTTWMVPPVRYPVSWESSRVSATTPWPAKAASPWTSTDSTSRHRSLLEHVLLGPDHALDDGVDGLEMRRVRRQRDGELGPGPGHELAVAPLWYLTSPEPWTESGSRSPSNSRKISP